MIFPRYAFKRSAVALVLAAVASSSLAMAGQVGTGPTKSPNSKPGEPEPADSAELCREVASIESISVLAALKKAYEGSAVSTCVAERLAKLQGSNPGEQRAPLSTFRDCPECPEMVVIPAGTFSMGSIEEDDMPIADDEMPLQEVTIAKGFAIGKFEVTFEEWDACVADGGCAHKPKDNSWGRGRRPVMDISWPDANEYVGWLTRRTGKTYRLPTEAEWEYAARGGETHSYMTGVRITLEQANHVGQVPEDPWYGQTRAVGSYPANAFGLFDVHGNVYEWTADCYDAGGNGQKKLDVSPPHCNPAIRGGSWYNYASRLRFGARGYQPAEDREDTTGMRVVRDLD